MRTFAIAFKSAGVNCDEDTALAVAENADSGVGALGIDDIGDQDEQG